MKAMCSALVGAKAAVRPWQFPSDRATAASLLETAPYLSLKAVMTMDFKPEGLVYTSGGATFRDWSGVSTAVTVDSR